MENYGYMHGYIVVEPIYSHWFCVPNFKLIPLKQTSCTIIKLLKTSLKPN
jgi:hypothetical protein